MPPVSFIFFYDFRPFEDLSLAFLLLSLSLTRLPLLSHSYAVLADSQGLIKAILESFQSMAMRLTLRPFLRSSKIKIKINYLFYFETKFGCRYYESNELKYGIHMGDSIRILPRNIIDFKH